MEPLELNFRPRWNPDSNPVEYTETTSALVSVIFEQNYTEAVLEAGYSDFYRNWKYQRWPVPGEIIPFFEMARQRTAQKQIPAAPKIHGEAWAEKVMRGEWGEIAAERRVANDLWCWAMKNPGEYPSGELLESFERSKAATAAMMQEERNQTKMIQDLYNAMQAREDYLCREYGRQREAS